MNKVATRCAKDGCAKFLFASNRMYQELKVLNYFLYMINIIPVIICFLPQTTDLLRLVCSIISFGLNLLNEVLSQFKANYKEKAILEHQLYESEITGSSFSKIEYDRESTNEMQELAIRKGLPRMKKVTEYPISDVPQEITDDYSYLYLCRKSAAIYRYLLSRMFYWYFIILIVGAVALIAATLTQNAGQMLYYLVCFWPLVLPLIKACTASKKAIKQCVKICADIDNFFADGDNSVERLARFYYYVQNIEFEMLTVRPTMYKFFQVLYSNGVRVLTDGVTSRFEDAIIELKSKKYYQKGLISQTSKSLITKVDYDLEELKRKERLLKQKRKMASTSTLHLNVGKNEPKVVQEKPIARTVRQTTTASQTSVQKSVTKTSTSKAPTKTATTRTTKATIEETKPVKTAATKAKTTTETVLKTPTTKTRSTASKTSTVAKPSIEEKVTKPRTTKATQSTAAIKTTSTRQSKASENSAEGTAKKTSTTKARQTTKKNA